MGGVLFLSTLIESSEEVDLLRGWMWGGGRDGLDEFSCIGVFDSGCSSAEEVDDEFPFVVGEEIHVFLVGEPTWEFGFRKERERHIEKEV